MVSILSGLLAMAAAHAGTLAAAGSAGVALEAALPWLTRAQRARKAIRVFREWKAGKKVDVDGNAVLPSDEDMFFQPLPPA